MRSLVMTVMGPDRPGLVEELSKVIGNHGGNWLESRMAHLAGHFAGLLRVECPEDKSEKLLESLQALPGLSVQAAAELEKTSGSKKTLRFDAIGNDRPGIVQELSSAIVRMGANVEELATNLESAPHAGHRVFHATGVVAVDADFDEGALLETLEALGPDLSVTLDS